MLSLHERVHWLFNASSLEFVQFLKVPVNHYVQIIVRRFKEVPNFGFQKFCIGPESWRSKPDRSVSHELCGGGELWPSGVGVVSREWSFAVAAFV